MYLGRVVEFADTRTLSARPVNAIPPRAWARCQLRFVVGVDPGPVLPALRRHLDRHGFGMVKLETTRETFFSATRIDPDDAWVQWAVASLARTTGKKPAVLPNLGGSLPNQRAPAAGAAAGGPGGDDGPVLDLGSGDTPPARS